MWLKKHKLITPKGLILNENQIVFKANFITQL